MTSRLDSTVDTVEISRFDNAEGWHPEGEARWLYRYNRVRVPYIRSAACQHFARDPDEPDCLRNLRILDIGCGAGVLCEPLAGLGATVVGADLASNSVELARVRALQAGLNIDYRCRSAEQLAADGERFDVVLAMEVIEHVADSDAFLRRCTELACPHGLVILSTISRTVKSYLFAIVMGEYVLRLLPPGTHQWRRFRTPAEIAAAVRPDGFRVTDVKGVTLKILAQVLEFSASSDVSYILTAKRP
jgi:2-polyprenyl-6-hydroxyphenyl methylase/3-demethylubiquinone-9 3-methyltransferase